MLLFLCQLVLGPLIEGRSTSDRGPIPRGDQISTYIHFGDKLRGVDRDDDRVVLVVSAHFSLPYWSAITGEQQS
jgi:hypothetical protein